MMLFEHLIIQLSARGFFFLLMSLSSNLISKSSSSGMFTSSFSLLSATCVYSVTLLDWWLAGCSFKE